MPPWASCTVTALSTARTTPSERLQDTATVMCLRAYRAGARGRTFPNSPQSTVRRLLVNARPLRSTSGLRRDRAPRRDPTLDQVVEVRVLVPQLRPRLRQTAACT